MKKILIPFLSVMLSANAIGQIDTAGLDAETKSKLIYVEIVDETSSSTYRMSDGSLQSGPTNRRVGVSFKLGESGEFQELDKDGENLRVIIKDDRRAMTQFNNAYKCRRKLLMYNILEITFEVGAVGLVAVGLIQKNKELPEGEDNKGAVIGSFVGAGVSLAAFYYCWFKSNQMLTKYGECIERAISFYNRTIIDANRAE